MSVAVGRRFPIQRTVSSSELTPGKPKSGLCFQISVLLYWWSWGESKNGDSPREDGSSKPCYAIVLRQDHALSSERLAVIRLLVPAALSVSGSLDGLSHGQHAL
jgi:hypothetical protein